MEHPIGFGTQTVPPGYHVREHSHDCNEEVIHVLKGRGRAVIDGADVPMVPATTLFLGKGRRHMLINKGEEDIIWMRMLVPNGLEDFFRAIGRTLSPGEPSPAPFPAAARCPGDRGADRRCAAARRPAAAVT
jgi:hypothetical protein